MGKVSDRGYLSRLNPIGNSSHIRVAPEEEIGPQLNAMGIRSADVRTVIMTHLYHDYWWPAPFPAQSHPRDRGVPEARLALGWIGRVGPGDLADLVCP
jgi:hypothetical protein